MAPNPKNRKNAPRNYEPQHDDFRNSSVLVPLRDWNGELEIVLTLRTASINHGGQISFPGGGREGDETIEETALREAQEEIGLYPESVEVAGTLTSLYVGHSDNMVTPVVGFLNKPQKFTPNPNEVDEVFSVSLLELAGDNNRNLEEWDLRGVPYNVPYWSIHRVPLWGATAMILNELIELYREFIAAREKS
ncbi:MAG: CoA pyrophosphatase [Balneolaceae bacterium]|nr:CoA pyrophosphatase [Balneolaceae bacterium]